jgi:hypothetical protein
MYAESADFSRLLRDEIPILSSCILQYLKWLLVSGAVAATSERLEQNAGTYFEDPHLRASGAALRNVSG